jgi:hypothetical protein
MIEIYKGIGWPDPLLQLLSGNQLAGMFQKNLEDLEGLLLQLDSCTLLAQFACPQVKLKVAEPDGFAGWGDALHVKTRRQCRTTTGAKF